MSRVYNFSAGPSMLPLSVIEDAAANLANYKGCGESVMEMSHRSAEFKAILGDAGLPGQRYVRHGDEPPLQGFPGHH